MKALLFCLFVFLMGLFQAQANDCKLPESFMGMTILFNISDRYTPHNEMAGMLLQSKFDNLTYDIEVLDTGERFSGKYQYQRIKSKIARFTVAEGTGDSLIQYSKTLVCQTDKMGFVLFKLLQGSTPLTPAHDIGIYVIQSSLKAE
ncbi:hypothetical protein [uncultured Shewanella sp.]|uniref:hypothetical protein n=1 Tax=uncultured Shewanella sp. TaxID=173975 RepID=UPI0026163446|nr:hypothetical protein [uncultured Shewanella sp.]